MSATTAAPPAPSDEGSTDQSQDVNFLAVAAIVLIGCLILFGLIVLVCKWLKKRTSPEGRSSIQAARDKKEEKRIRKLKKKALDEAHKRGEEGKTEEEELLGIGGKGGATSGNGGSESEDELVGFGKGSKAGRGTAAGKTSDTKSLFSTGSPSSPLSRAATADAKSRKGAKSIADAERNFRARRERDDQLDLLRDEDDDDDDDELEDDSDEGWKDAHIRNDPVLSSLFSSSGAAGLGARRRRKRKNQFLNKSTEQLIKEGKLLPMGASRRPEPQSFHRSKFVCPTRRIVIDNIPEASMPAKLPETIYDPQSNSFVYVSAEQAVEKRQYESLLNEELEAKMRAERERAKALEEQVQKKKKKNNSQPGSPTAGAGGGTTLLTIPGSPTGSPQRGRNAPLVALPGMKFDDDGLPELPPELLDPRRQTFKIGEHRGDAYSQRVKEMTAINVPAPLVPSLSSMGGTDAAVQKKSRWVAEDPNEFNFKR